MQTKSFLLTLTLIIVLLGARVNADLYPREIFHDLQSLFQSYQIEVDYEDLEESEDEIMVNNLTLSTKDSFSSYVFELPTFRIVRKGTNLVEIMMPDTFVISRTLGDVIPVEIGQGTFTGTKRMIIEQDVEGNNFDYSIEQVEIRTLDERFAFLVVFQDILGKVQFEDFTKIADEGFLSSSSIGEFTGRFQSRESAGFAFKGTNFTSNSTDKGLRHNKYLGIELPLGDFDFSVETSQFILELEDGSTLGFLINQLSNQMTVNEDGLMMNSDTKDFVIAYEGIVQDAVAASDTEFDFTVDWSDANEKFNLENDISLNNIQWDSTYMELLDPQSEFSGEVGSLNVNYKLTGNGALLELEGNEEINPEEIEFSLLSGWEVRVLDLWSKGLGEFQYNRGNTSGNAEVSIEGAENFANRLVAAQFVPPEYATVVITYMTLLDPNSTSGNSLNYLIEMDNEFEVLVNGNSLGPIYP